MSPGKDAVLTEEGVCGSRPPLARPSSLPSLHSQLGQWKTFNDTNSTWEQSTTASEGCDIFEQDALHHTRHILTAARARVMDLEAALAKGFRERAEQDGVIRVLRTQVRSLTSRVVDLSSDARGRHPSSASTTSKLCSNRRAVAELHGDDSQISVVRSNSVPKGVFHPQEGMRDQTSKRTPFVIDGLGRLLRRQATDTARSHARMCLAAWRSYPQRRDALLSEGDHSFTVHHVCKTQGRPQSMLLGFILCWRNRVLEIKRERNAILVAPGAATAPSNSKPVHNRHPQIWISLSICWGAWRAHLTPLHCKPSQGSSHAACQTCDDVHQICRFTAVARVVRFQAEVQQACTLKLAWTSWNTYVDARLARRHVTAAIKTGTKAARYVVSSALKKTHVTYTAWTYAVWRNTVRLYAWKIRMLQINPPMRKCLRACMSSWASVASLAAHNRLKSELVSQYQLSIALQGRLLNSAHQLTATSRSQQDATLQRLVLLTWRAEMQLTQQAAASQRQLLEVLAPECARVRMCLEAWGRCTRRLRVDTWRQACKDALGRQAHAHYVFSTACSFIAWSATVQGMLTARSDSQDQIAAMQRQQQRSVKCTATSLAFRQRSLSRLLNVVTAWFSLLVLRRCRSDMVRCHAGKALLQVKRLSLWAWSVWTVGSRLQAKETAVHRYRLSVIRQVAVMSAKGAADNDAHLSKQVLTCWRLTIHALHGHVELRFHQKMRVSKIFRYWALLSHNTASSRPPRAKNLHAHLTMVRHSVLGLFERAKLSSVCSFARCVWVVWRIAQVRESWSCRIQKVLCVRLRNSRLHLIFLKWVALSSPTQSTGCTLETGVRTLCQDVSQRHGVMSHEKPCLREESLQLVRYFQHWARHVVRAEAPRIAATFAFMTRMRCCLRLVLAVWTHCTQLLRCTTAQEHPLGQRCEDEPHTYSNYLQYFAESQRTRALTSSLRGWKSLVAQRSFTLRPPETWTSASGPHLVRGCHPDIEPVETPYQLGLLKHAHSHPALPHTRTSEPTCGLQGRLLKSHELSGTARYAHTGSASSSFRQDQARCVPPIPLNTVTSLGKVCTAPSDRSTRTPMSTPRSLQGDCAGTPWTGLSPDSQSVGRLASCFSAGVLPSSYMNPCEVKVDVKPPSMRDALLRAELRARGLS